MSSATIRPISLRRRQSLWQRIRNNWGLLLLLLPTLTFIIVFHYIPMYGILIAFKDYRSTEGILGSPWTDNYGLKNFINFFNSYNAKSIVFNTLRISLYTLLAATPCAIIFALLLNYLPQPRYKKVVQTVTYAPHFISTVVVAGMLYLLLAPTSGIINRLIMNAGGRSIFFLNSAKWFPHVYVWSHVWQHMGWDSILYIAALTGIDPQLHEAAIVDGASKMKRILHIDLPGILPTIIIVLILNAGSLMSVGFEKAYLIQNNLNIQSSEILSTYVYKVGLINNQFSFSTAIGLVNSLVNFGMLVLVNTISKRLTQNSLW